MPAHDAYERNATLVDRFVIFLGSAQERVFGHVRVYLEPPSSGKAKGLNYDVRYVVRLVHGTTFIGTFEKVVPFRPDRVFDDLERSYGSAARPLRVLETD